MYRAAAFVCALSLFAQDSRFEARSRLVLVPVTVNDANGRTIDGLDATDFLVLDNNIVRKVTVDTIDTGVAPISLVIAVQSSGISAAALEKVHKIGGLIRPLVTGERGCAAVLSFAAAVKWQQQCTSNTDAIESALLRIQPGDPRKARMLDAVKEAIGHLNERADFRRVLLLVSETRDRGSETDLASAIIAAQSAGITVYAATYSAFLTTFTSKAPSGFPGLRNPVTAVPNPQNTVDGGISNKYNPHLKSPQESLDAITAIGELARLGKTDTTRALAEQTAGITLPFTRQRGLEEAIEKLGSELHRQYVLSFVPPVDSSGYHRLEVRLNRPGDFRIRARPAYWSAQ